MARSTTTLTLATITSLGSLITPVAAVVAAATDPVSAGDLARTRSSTGVEVTTETVRSNHVIVALVVLLGYVLLAAAFWWAVRRADRGGAIAGVVAAIAWVAGAVMWSGAALDGAAGWALRAVVTLAGLIALVLAMVGASRPRTGRAVTDDWRGTSRSDLYARR